MTKFENEREWRTEVVEVSKTGVIAKDDVLAVEEPMEIRVVFGPSEKRRGKSLSITMRTPGNDFELAVGFLYTEGVIASASEIASVEFVGPKTEGRNDPNAVRVELVPGKELDISKFQRHFYTTSSCGICGKASLDALKAQGFERLIESPDTIDADLVFQLPDRLRAQQDVFEKTGGLHAAGLFNGEGSLVSIREDVGRHNALDKLIGEQLLNPTLPMGKGILVVSGRASFELLQKTLTASIPIMIAVGAPSSLAVELAAEYNLTLIGFASSTRFNIYSGRNRIS